MRKSKKKKGEVAYKIDLEKAYDHVSWEFLRHTLLDFGFPPLMVSLIMQCVTTPTLSILWNGKRLPTFSPTRGLRQGDPLSPYLFVLCMEKLSLAIQKEVEDGNWVPFRFPKNGPPVSHLLFADDVLLFTKARSSQARKVSSILEKFGQASGLKVNVNKSRAFFSAGVPPAKARKSTQITQIREAKTLEKYLGFPLSHGRQTKKDFDFITDRMTSRLASWKHNLLNRAGRVTLASSVLSAIPSYYMQTCWLPQNVCNHIDKISRDFIWKGNQNKGLNLVNWHQVTLPKSLGGLGIRTARETNTSLLGKLVWDLQQDRDKLWVHLLKHKYKVEGNFLNSSSKVGSSTWGAISKAKSILRGGFEFRIGEGNLSLWFDHWTEPGPLHNFFPYIDIHDLDTKVHEIFVRGEWDMDRLYTVFPEHLSNFIKGSNIKLNQGVKDLFIWKNSPNGCYTTKSGFNWLIQQRDLPTAEIPWRWIWKLPAQQNIRLFFWLAFNKSIPTLSTLHHRGISTTAVCRICQGVEEMLLHCIRDCPSVTRLWRKLGFSDDNFFITADVLVWLKQGATGPNDTLFIAGVWWAWKARNAYCFNGETIPFLRLHLATINLAATFQVCFKPQGTAPTQIRQISWLQRDREGYVLNVDGSSLGNPGPAGFGGLIRHADGGWVCGFSGHIGHSEVLKAELMRIISGLKLAWDRGFRNITCYTDSLVAKLLINEHNIEFHRFATIIQEIRDFLALPWTVELKHTLREGNMCADHLAKLGARSDVKLQIFETPPSDLHLLLTGDAAGVAYPRGYPNGDMFV